MRRSPKGPAQTVLASGGTSRVIRPEIVSAGPGTALCAGGAQAGYFESLGTGTAFRTFAEWNVEARAGHWGPLHWRRIRFSALMELMPVENAWKFIGLTAIDVRQES